jgi:hypothetical protein
LTTCHFDGFVTLMTCHFDDLSFLRLVTLMTCHPLL